MGLGLGLGLGDCDVHVEERHEARERLPQQHDGSEGPSLEAREQRRLEADVPRDHLLRVSARVEGFESGPGPA